MTNQASSLKDGILRYGAADTASATSARRNFAGPTISTLSLCTTPIELLSNDGENAVIATATGFFWEKDGQPHLVTNYHVISGRNPFTGEYTSKMGYAPCRVRYYGVAIAEIAGQTALIRNPVTLLLGEGYDKIVEKPPEVNGVGVDVWAVPIDRSMVFGKDPNRKGFNGADVASCFVNQHSGRPIVTNAGDDCFILGYPLENYEGLMPPVWKRGSIASDTNLGVGGRPIFLVDAAVTPSMSGSPIFRKATTITVDNRDIGAIQELSTFEFIGVYAGRLESAKLMATNIGYAWHKVLIEDVIAYYNYSGGPLAG